MDLVMIFVKMIGILVVGFLSIVLFVRLMPFFFNIDVIKEIRSGNTAASIFVLGIYLFIGLSIGFFINNIL